MNEANTSNATACPVVGSQVATVCLPVSIKPYVTTSPSCVQCCGDMTISHCCNHCKGMVNGSCDFTITQKIRIDVPVEFGATVKVGDTYVDCVCTNEEAVLNDPFCNHCNDLI